MSTRHLAKLQLKACLAALQNINAGLSASKGDPAKIRATISGARADLAAIRKASEMIQLSQIPDRDA